MPPSASNFQKSSTLIHPAPLARSVRPLYQTTSTPNSMPCPTFTERNSRHAMRTLQGTCAQLRIPLMAPSMIFGGLEYLKTTCSSRKCTTIHRAFDSLSCSVKPQSKQGAERGSGMSSTLRTSCRLKDTRCQRRCGESTLKKSTAGSGAHTRRMSSPSHAQQPALWMRAERR